MKIEKDKIYHFLACMVMVVSLVLFHMPLEYAAAYTLLFSILGKELIYDKLILHGEFSYEDMCTDIFGTVVGCIPAIMYLKLIVGV